MKTEEAQELVPHRPVTGRPVGVPGLSVAVIDHHDSYTWNLVHLLAEASGVMPEVFQHDDVQARSLERFTHVVLSPGPGDPSRRSDFRVGRDLLKAPAKPILGVCLGMQGIVISFGGSVSRTRPAHGLVGEIHHDGQGVFRGIPNPFTAVRYHSLAVSRLPSGLEVTATTTDGTVMGVRHSEWPVEGVQFHPESILSQHGPQMMRNFLATP